MIPTHIIRHIGASNSFERMVRKLLRLFLGWAAHTRRVKWQRRWQRLMLHVPGLQLRWQRRWQRLMFRAWLCFTDEALVSWLLRVANRSVACGT